MSQRDEAVKNLLDTLRDNFSANAGVMMAKNYDSYNYCMMQLYKAYQATSKELDIALEKIKQLEQKAAKS